LHKAGGEGRKPAEVVFGGAHIERYRLSFDVAPLAQALGEWSQQRCTGVASRWSEITDARQFSLGLREEWRYR